MDGEAIPLPMPETRSTENVRKRPSLKIPLGVVIDLAHQLSHKHVSEPPSPYLTRLGDQAVNLEGEAVNREELGEETESVITEASVASEGEENFEMASGGEENNLKGAVPLETAALNRM